MFSYLLIILTFKGEQHLPSLINSIKELNTPVFILDSGSTDNTLKIAKEFGAKVIKNINSEIIMLCNITVISTNFILILNGYCI